MTQKHKYVIIGAGPAGLQMAYFLKKAGLDYLILEQNKSVGSFFEKNPVHRQLISINKKYNFFKEVEYGWRHDWNSLLSDDPNLRFTNYTDDLFPHADVMVKYLKDYNTHFNFNIHYEKKINHIVKDENGSFVLTTSDHSVYCAEVLLMGTGAIAPKIPNEIEGIEHAVLYSDQSIDLSLYKNKRVAILGGGNSAFETGNYLAGSAAFVHILTKHPLKMAWDTHFVGHLRAVNNQIIDMYQLKSMHAILNPRLLKITKTNQGTFITNHEYDYPNSEKPGTLKLSREYDIIINCTGWRWANTELFDDAIKPITKYNGKFLELKPNWESINVSNLFYIGGAMQSIDRTAASGFIHGFRYNIRSLFHLLMNRFEDKSLPSETYYTSDLTSFFNHFYKRLSTSAGLYQMFGVLCDYLIFDDTISEAKYYEELPLKYIQENLHENLHTFSFTLELGFHKHKYNTSLEFMGPSDPNDTHNAVFLHPVIRHYFKGKTEEFHFGDSLLGRWDMIHQDGGAVESYHIDFVSWLEKKLDKKIHLKPNNEITKSNYVVW